MRKSIVTLPLHQLINKNSHKPQFVLRNTSAVLRTILSASVCAALTSGVVSAADTINEKPVANKQYDQFLHYDANGTQNFSLQGSVEGEQHHYYFNQGALLDASDGTTNAAVLAHNWGNFNTSTAEIFHVGEGKEFTIKNYRGYSALEAEEGATLRIDGGTLTLESGILSTAGMDNTNSAIHMENSGVIDIDVDSFWIGNKRTEDRENVGAISMAGDNNVLDIDVASSFTAVDVDMGIALQTQGSGSYAGAFIDANDDITINALRSDGG